MKVKHIKTPVKTKPGMPGVIEDAEGYVIATTHGRLLFECCIVTDEIIRAINAHDALVEAVIAARVILAAQNESNGGLYQFELGLIDTALKQAEG